MWRLRSHWPGAILAGLLLLASGCAQGTPPGQADAPASSSSSEATRAADVAKGVPLNLDAPERVFRRGETPLPILRQYVNRSGAIIHVEVKQEGEQVALKAYVGGEVLFDAVDGTEKLEEVFVSDLIADGPGELVVTTRQDCSLLHFRLFTLESGQWQLVIDQPDVANGVMGPGNMYHFLTPATGGGYMDHFVRYGSTQLGSDGIRTWEPGWNTHYSTLVAADPATPLSPIPDCPAR